MNIFSRMRRRAQNRRVYSDLMKMDDHMLADMGVTRQDLTNLMTGRGLPGNRTND